MERVTSSEINPHTNQDLTVDAAIIAAGRECIIRDGVRRTTMAGVARAAHVSRPTVYHRYRNVAALTTDLLTRELVGILDHVRHLPNDLDELVAAIAEYTEVTSNNELLRSIVRTDPELLTTYLFQRLGQSQQHLIKFLKMLIRRVQKSDEAHDRAVRIRTEDPQIIATGVLMICQTAALSAEVAFPSPEGGGPNETWRQEFTRLLKGYLAQ